MGRAIRARLPRSAHAEWSPGSRRDPLERLEAESSHRIPGLVPLRWARMAASPFSFYRGAAGVMAADLAATAVTGVDVQVCGDAHLLNFGLYASPERTLMFDLNDFDETLRGPWEWDLKRLATSAVIAARSAGLGRHEAASAARNRTLRRATRRASSRASSRDHLHAFSRLTEVVDGRPRLRDRPPLVVRLEDFLPAEQVAAMPE